MKREKEGGSREEGRRGKEGVEVRGVKEAKSGSYETPLGTAEKAGFLRLTVRVKEG